MNITVIICTYNRCRLLAKALESVAVSSLPVSIEWEVLVVDNNSSDQTRGVVEDFSSRYPGRFRYLFESQPGKSFALNTGVRNARGGILAFMDDDVTVEPTWLHNLTSELHSAQWAGAGGPILPESSFRSFPHWLQPDLPHALAPLALFNLGPDAGVLSQPPFGTNMAFRKDIFDRYGYFRTDLGPQPDSILRGEDTEFGKRILAAGLQLRYVPSAKVFHAMREDRLQKRYFLAWWFDKGRSDLREFGMRPDFRHFLGGVSLRMLFRLVVWTLRWMFAIKPPRRFFCNMQVRWLLGQIVESRRVSTKVQQPKKELSPPPPLSSL